MGEMITVADYIALFLKGRGVNHVFGFQGSAILKIIDSMRHVGDITYLQNYHEQASAFAADAYARTAGVVGVAVATSGPGATNLITGIANAHLDSVPCIFITGQVETRFICDNDECRQQGFQQIDIVSMVRPITKYAAVVKRPEDIGKELSHAWSEALSGRKGAVLLDVPLDVQFALVDSAELEVVGSADVIPDAFNVEPALDVLLGARNPLILVGGGVRSAGAEESLELFCTLTGIPVVATLNGLDACAGVRGLSGLFGRTDTNLLVANADVILVLGSRLAVHQIGKRPEQYPSARIIQVDVDSVELGRVLPASPACCVDVAVFLERAIDALSQRDAERLRAALANWRNQADAWSREYSDTVLVNGGGFSGVDPVRFCRELIGLMPQDTVYCADVGQNQMWLAQAFSPAPGRRLLNSAGHGCMGFALPASIGARFAAPGKHVVAIMGDGGLQMNLQELQMISSLSMDILCIVLNNNTLGMMRDSQRKYFDSRYVGSSPEYFSCVDMKKLSALYGLKFLSVYTHEDVQSIRSMIEHKGPKLIEVVLGIDSVLHNRLDDSELFHLLAGMELS
jgi:acetolactate synthase-1/2/3 large subunit